MVFAVSQITENFLKIKQDIVKYSPHPESVTLMGVTKFQPLEKITEAIESGLTHLGVNYVQEGEKLRNVIPEKELTWHFIGHIQSRKAKLLLDYDFIDSLDRLEVAADLNKRAQERGKTLKVLVEVNIGRENQKSGVLPEDLDNFCQSLSGFSQLKIAGLMAMPPALDPEQRRPFFKQMRSFYEKLGLLYPFETLSMGTSEDYSIALQEGANCVRLGTVLFGARPAK